MKRPGGPVPIDSSDSSFAPPVAHSLRAGARLAGRTSAWSPQRNSRCLPVSAHWPLVPYLTRTSPNTNQPFLR
eukprot:7295251-Alexandrium_andersonii.AAC.1